MYKMLLKLLVVLSVAIFITSCGGGGDSGGGSGGGGSGGGGGENGGGGGNAKFTVNFYDGADELNSLTRTQIPAGTEITLQNPPSKQGYTFAGWLVNNTGEANGAKYTVIADLILFASWKPQTYSPPIYTVVFYNGSEIDHIVQGLMDDKTSLSDPANIPDGYEFKGWLVNSTGEPLTGEYTVKGNVILFPLYEPVSPGTPALYTAAFYDNGALIEFFTATEDEEITLPNYYNPSLTLRGWREENVSGYLKQPLSQYKVGYDVNFYASWALPTVTLKFFNEKALLKTITVPKGRKISLPLKDDFPELAGINKPFTGWKSGNKTYAGTITADGNMNFTAVWQNTNSATIRYFIKGELVDSDTVLEGGIITLPRIEDFLTAQSNPVTSGGYTFTGWCINNQEDYCYDEGYNTVPLYDNFDLHARWSHTVAAKKVKLHYYVDIAPFSSAEEFPVNAISLLTQQYFKDYDRTLWNHYIFNGWKGNDDNIISNFIAIDTDTDLHGDFTLKDFDEIKNDTDLRNINNNLSGRYRLMNDIYIKDGGWTPIGGEFKGVLEGAGHRIENLKISGAGNAGLFNAIGGNYLNGSARITDLTIMLANGGISGTSAGGLAGLIPYDSTHIRDKLKIINVHVKESRSGGGSILSGVNAGGITGYLKRDFVFIMDSSNAVDISSSEYAGGLVGMMEYSDRCFIINSHNTGDVNANNPADSFYAPAYAGGIAGRSNGADAYIDSSYNSGSISASGFGAVAAGGISGSSNAHIQNSYNTGRVTASGGYNDTYAGGLAGLHTTHIIDSSYNSGDVSAEASRCDGSSYCNAYAGGIAGKKDINELSNSYNTGSVSAAVGSGYTAYAGGIAGFQGGASKINFNYNTGNILASGGNVYAAGVVGYLEYYTQEIRYNAAINMSVSVSGNGALKANRILGGVYYNISYNPPTQTNNNLARHPMLISIPPDDVFKEEDIFRGIRKGIEEFRQQQTYTAIGWKFCNNNPCNNANPWKMSNSSPYPVLYWQ